RDAFRGRRRRRPHRGGSRRGPGRSRPPRPRASRQAGARRWDQEKNPSAAAGAVFAVLGLGAIDILILLPILMTVVGVLFGFFMAAIGLFVGGGAVMVAGPFAGFPGGGLAAVLAGLGMMAGATAIGALTAIATILLVNATVWFARLHYRLLKPALESHAQA